MTVVWVYIVICLDSLWCIPEHNRWSGYSYASQQECFDAARQREEYVLQRGWKAFCIEGRKLAPREGGR